MTKKCLLKSALSASKNTSNKNSITSKAVSNKQSAQCILGKNTYLEKAWVIKKLKSEARNVPVTQQI